MNKTQPTPEEITAVVSEQPDLYQPTVQPLDAVQDNGYFPIEVDAEDKELAMPSLAKLATPSSDKNWLQRFKVAAKTAVSNIMNAQMTHNVALGNKKITLGKNKEEIEFGRRMASEAKRQIEEVMDGTEELTAEEAESWAAALGGGSVSMVDFAANLALLRGLGLGSVGAQLGAGWLAGRAGYEEGTMSDIDKYIAETGDKELKNYKGEKKAFVANVASGAIQGSIESATSGLGRYLVNNPLAKKVLGKTGNDAIRKMASTAVGRTLAAGANESVNNAFEEWTQALTGNIAEIVKGNEEFSMDNILNGAGQAAGVGALLGWVATPVMQEYGRRKTRDWISDKLRKASEEKGIPLTETEIKDAANDLVGIIESKGVQKVSDNYEKINQLAGAESDLAQTLTRVFEDLVNQGQIKFRQATPDEIRQAGLDWANYMQATALLDSLDREIPISAHPLFNAVAEADRIFLEGRDPATGDLLPLDINNAQVRELANQIEDYIEQNRETRQAEEASKLVALREADMRARQETIQELERAAIAELEKEQAEKNQERIIELQQQITELQHQMDLLREERSQYVKERAAQGRISIGRAKAQTAPDNKALTKKAIRSGNLDIITQILQDNGFKTRDLSGTQIKQMAQLNWEKFAGRDLGMAKSKYDQSVAMKAIEQNVVSGDAVLLRAGYTQGQIDQMDDKTWNRALLAAYREETEALESAQQQLTPEQLAQIPDDMLYQDLAAENARLDDMYPAYTGETINIDGKERTVYNSNGERIAQSEPALRNFYKWFGNSKVVDEQGRPLVVYHQTSETFNKFERGRDKAGKYDYETPGGFFFKSSDRNIGIAGNIQMPVYLKAEKTITFDNRQQLQKYWSENIDGYADLLKQYQNVDADYNARVDNIESDMDKAIDDLENSESYKNATDAQQYQMRSDLMDSFDSTALFDEWKNAANKIAEQMKQLVNDYVSANNIEMVKLENDSGAIGKKTTDSFIVFEPTQIKSVNNRGTFSEDTRNIYYQDQVVENPVLLDLEDITSDMNVDSVLDLVLSGQDMWDNLIDPVKYKNALQEFVKNGQLIRTKTEDVEQWFETIVRNTALLDTITDIVGHSYSFPETEIKEYFFGTNRAEADKKFQEYKKQLQERDEELPPEFATAEVESTANEEISDGAVLWKLLEDKGFFDNAKLPDGSPAWSDFGLRPLWEIIGEYHEGMSAEQVLVLINKALDVYHQNGDLASAFIKGGAETAEKISNDYPLDNMMQYQPGYVSLKGELIGKFIDADQFYLTGEGSSAWAYGNYFLANPAIDKRHYFDRFEQSGPVLKYDGAEITRRKLNEMGITYFDTQNLIMNRLPDLQISKDWVVKSLETLMNAAKTAYNEKINAVVKILSPLYDEATTRAVIKDIEEIMKGAGATAGALYNFPKSLKEGKLQEKHLKNEESKERFTMIYRALVEEFGGEDHLTTYENIFARTIADIISQEKSLEAVKALDFDKFSGRTGLIYKNQSIKDFVKSVQVHYWHAEDALYEAVRNAIVKGDSPAKAAQNIKAPEMPFAIDDLNKDINELIKSKSKNVLTKEESAVVRKVFDEFLTSTDTGASLASIVSNFELTREQGEVINAVLDSLDPQKYMLDKKTEWNPGVADMFFNIRNNMQVAKDFENVKELFKDAKDSDFVYAAPASMYKTNAIPENKYLLDMGKPISKQSDYVKEALKKLYADTYMGTDPIATFNVSPKEFLRDNDVSDKIDYSKTNYAAWEVNDKYRYILRRFMDTWIRNGLQRATEYVEGQIEQNNKTIQNAERDAKNATNKNDKEMFERRVAIVSVERDINKYLLDKIKTIPSDAKIDDYAFYSEAFSSSTGKELYDSIQQEFSMQSVEGYNRLKPSDIGAKGAHQATSKLLLKYGIKGVRYWGKRDKRGFVSFEPTPVSERLYQDNLDKSDSSDKLVVSHGISLNSINKALALGGLPSPSIAISKASDPLTDFGTIKLVGTKEMIDPENEQNLVYDRDIWSAMFPRPVYKNATKTASDKFRDKFRKAFIKADEEDLLLNYILYLALNSANPGQVVDMFANSFGAQIYYLEHVLGKTIDVPMTERYDLKDIYFLKPDQRFIDEVAKIDINESYDAWKGAFRKAANDLIAREGVEDRYQNIISRVYEYYDDLSFPIAVRMVQDIKNYAQNNGLKVNRLELQYLLDAYNLYGDKNYEKWASEQTESLLGEPKIKVGNKKLDWTLDNITKAMIQKSVVNSATGGYSIGNIIAAGGKKLESLEEIKSEGRKLKTKADSEAETDSIGRRITEFASDILKQFEESGNSTFSSSFEDVYMALVKAANLGSITESALNNLLNKALEPKERINFDKEVLKEGVKFTKEISGLTRYFFEAKPQRSVRFEEFVGAIVPPDALYDEVAANLVGRGLVVIRTDDIKGGVEAIEQIKQGTVFQNKKTSKSTTGLGTEHRGGYDPMTKAIIFNKTSDLTTLFHESAHYWFDRNLRYYRTGLASPEWKKKWEDVMNELGATPNARGTIPVSAVRSASEKFARSMEAYLREGKYESAAIQWAHQDYANMVKRVYRNIWSTYWGLDDLSPAVKQWFDMFGLKTDDATTAFAEEDKIETDEQMVGAVIAEDATKPDVDAETKAIVADAGAQVVENPATQEIAVVPADPFETGKKARSKLPRSAEAATGASMDDIIYNRRSMSDAFKAAQQLVNTDPVRAWEILKGGQEMVDGLYAGDIYRALIAKYQAENNPTMLKNVVQAFAGAARRAGRSVKAFDLESPRISFEKTINSLDKIFDTKKNDKRIEKVKNELKEFLHDPSALRVGWEEFKNIVGCK